MEQCAYSCWHTFLFQSRHQLLIVLLLQRIAKERELLLEFIVEKETLLHHRVGLNDVAASDGLFEEFHIILKKQRLASFGELQYGIVEHAIGLHLNQSCLHQWVRAVFKLSQIADIEPRDKYVVESVELKILVVNAVIGHKIEHHASI